jgi:hypothetical protein
MQKKHPLLTPPEWGGKQEGRIQPRAYATWSSASFWIRIKMDQTSKTSTFRFPKSVKWIFLICGSAFFCFEIIGIRALQENLTDHPNPRGLVVTLFFILMFALAGLYSLRFGLKCDDCIETSAEGIKYISKRGKSTLLRWQDISSIKERIQRQRLVLYDNFGNRAMNLEYQLDNFNELRAIIQEKTPHLHIRNAQIKLFHTSYCKLPVNIIGFLGIFMFLGLGYLTYRDDQIGVAKIFCAFALFEAIVFFMSLLTTIQKIEIKNKEVILKYFLRQRPLPYSRIDNIQLQNASDSKGNQFSEVILKVKDQKEIKLVLIKEGTIALYDSLHDAWGCSKQS